MNNKKMMYPIEAYQKAVRTVSSEPEFPTSIFHDLGFWYGLGFLCWMVTHPVESARAAVRATKTSIMERLHEDFLVKPEDDEDIIEWLNAYVAPTEPINLAPTMESAKAYSRKMAAEYRPEPGKIES